jgi:hypothetical protein
MHAMPRRAGRPFITPPPTQLPNRLREVRQAAGLSLAKLAALAGMKVGTPGTDA